MPITVNHNPSVALWGQYALQTGQGIRDERELLRRVQQQQAARDRQLRLQMQQRDIDASAQRQQAQIDAAQQQQLQDQSFRGYYQDQDNAYRQDALTANLWQDRAHMAQQGNQFYDTQWQQQRQFDAQNALAQQQQGFNQQQAGQENALGWARMQQYGDIAQAQLESPLRNQKLLDQYQWTTDQQRKLDKLRQAEGWIDQQYAQKNITEGVQKRMKAGLYAEFNGLQQSAIPASMKPSVEEQVNQQIVPWKAPDGSVYPVILDPETGAPQIMRGFSPPKTSDAGIPEFADLTKFAMEYIKTNQSEDPVTGQMIGPSMADAMQAAFEAYTLFNKQVKPQTPEQEAPQITEDQAQREVMLLKESAPFDTEYLAQLVGEFPNIIKTQAFQDFLIEVAQTDIDLATQIGMALNAAGVFNGSTT